jgi:hypothetical protein
MRDAFFEGMQRFLVDGFTDPTKKNYGRTVRWIGNDFPSKQIDHWLLPNHSLKLTESTACFFAARHEFTK